MFLVPILSIGFKPATPAVYVDWRNQGFSDGPPDYPWNTVSEGIVAVRPAPAGCRLPKEQPNTETLVVNRFAIAVRRLRGVRRGRYRVQLAASFLEICMHSSMAGGSRPVVTISCPVYRRHQRIDDTRWNSAARGGGLSIQQGASVKVGKPGSVRDPRDRGGSKRPGRRHRPGHASLVHPVKPTCFATRPPRLVAGRISRGRPRCRVTIRRQHGCE